ncbi:hypothetical protein [Paenibacillus sp.]|uniref:CDI toxin immunity protein n=1 Tax=Paenibacillus sp. TaxID=58172 RepID=UPI0028AD2807|nr:hypothetical protein [Paenibacillus sp.]
MDTKHRKDRLQYLLQHQDNKNRRIITSSLFDECIQTLGKQTIIFSSEKSKEIYKDFSAEYKITFYGRIEWSNYDFIEITAEVIENNKTYIDSSNEMYVLWSHGEDPVVQTTLESALENLSNITAVSPDVWFYRPNEFVIEIFHDGVIRGHKKY